MKREQNANELTRDNQRCPNNINTERELIRIAAERARQLHAVKEEEQ